MKSLKKFKNYDEYHKTEHFKPLISLIEKNINVLTYPINTIKSWYTNCGDFLFYDKKHKNTFFIKKQNLNYFSNNDIFVPIGIVVVPRNS